MGINFFKPEYLFRPLQIFRRISYALSPKEGTVKFSLPWGGKLVVKKEDFLGRSLLTTGFYELEITEILLRLMRPGMRVVDIGANAGYFTHFMAQQVGSKGEVLAFEPHPDTFRSLVTNMESHPNKLITALYNLALSNQVGNGSLHFPSGFAANTGSASLEETNLQTEGQVSVPLDTLDRIAGGKSIDILKMDVEGHELAVLQGSVNMLDADEIGVIILEDWKGEAVAYLQERGWEVKLISRSLLGPVLLPVGKGLHRVGSAPNFIASKQKEAFAVCQERGWTVFSL